jgi:hypothetical protein
MYAWDAKTLDDKEISEELQKQLYEQPLGKIIKICFVGEKSQYLL